MWISRKAFELFQSESERKTEDLRKAYERIDRLTEAIGRKADVPLTMPEPSFQPRTFIPQPLEPASTWWDVGPIPAIPPEKTKQ